MARGRWVIMGDADDSYDFGVIGEFHDRLVQGFDIVQGCRLERGGGTVLPGAMPVLHRWWGNPMFTRLANVWFNVPVSDVYCGMRGFRRQFYDELDLRCTGMEFATEMLIKSSLFEAKIAEIPITLHPDGRVSHAAHLRTFRDGWRTLRCRQGRPSAWAVRPGKAPSGLRHADCTVTKPGCDPGSRWLIGVRPRCRSQ